MAGGLFDKNQISYFQISDKYNIKSGNCEPFPVAYTVRLHQTEDNQ